MAVPQVGSGSSGVVFKADAATDPLAADALSAAEAQRGVAADAALAAEQATDFYESLVAKGNVDPTLLATAQQAAADAQSKAREALGSLIKLEQAANAQALLAGAQSVPY